MQPREPRAWPHKRRMLCAALTLYSASPGAHAAQDGEPHLKLTPELSVVPVEPDTTPREPLQLTLSYELTAPEDLPRAPSAPLPLQLALAISSTAPGATTPPPVPKIEIGGSGAQPVFYAVRINGQDFGVARLLRTADGRWYARREDLEAWRFTRITGKPILFGGEEHYPLDAFEGLTVRVDEPLQALDITFAPQNFAESVVEAGPAKAPKPVASGPGGFLNYDLLLSSAGVTHTFGGIFEGGVFNRYGALVSSFTVPDATDSSRVVRLETSWRRDFPEEMKSLIVGDAIGSSGVWGRPVRFGGLRYGTNFATNPGYITFPLPGFRGEAALPTTTDIYVDGVLRQSSNVPPGPFRLNNVPVVTGQGEVRVVVRDLLGREQVINLPYYASTQLLRQGLRDDSYEVGFVRENFGLRSDDYGRFVATVQRRKGFTDYVTGEARAELLRDQQTVGAGGSIAPPRIGVFSGAVAASHSDEGEGALLFTGFERQVRQGVSFGLRSQWTTERFRQLGFQPDQRPPVRLTSANIGAASAAYGSFGVAYVREDNRDRADAEIVSASYTVNLARTVALILFASSPLKGEGSHAVGVTLSVGLGERTSASANFTQQPHATQGFVQVQQNLPTGPGTAYRLLTGYGPRSDREEGGFSWQTNYGTYTVEAGRADNQTAVRAGATGGIGVLDGRVFLARELTDSFAVAHVPDFPNVAVSLNNQPIGRTDASGYLIVPRVLPYQANVVAIETADLPLDAEIRAAQLDAVPYYRSGLLLNFPVQRVHGALLVIVLEDGTPLPAGAVVTVIGRGEPFPVAQRGEAYVTGLNGRNRIRATWSGGVCELEVDIAPDAGPQPKLGPLTCKRVKS